VTRLFVENANQRLNELRSAAQTSDMEKIESSAHSLKGSSANLGARKLSSMCGVIVDQVRKNNLPENIHELVVEIENELDFTSKYLLQEHRRNG
jgi:HPt (histidine-containing phosphotransfer) domain-containing protein